MADVTQPKAAAAAPVREERIKLRSACDRCSLNKIKCSQDKPECQRCKTIGAQCHYSRSMRMGKPRKSAKAKAMMNAKLPGKADDAVSGSGSPNSNSGNSSNGAATTNNNSNNNDQHQQQQQQQQQHLPPADLPWSTDWSFDNLLAAHDHGSSPADPFKTLFDHHGSINNGNAVVPTADIMTVDALSAGYSHSDDAFLSFPQSPLSLQKPPKDESENVYLSPSSYYAPSFESTLLSTASNSPFEELGPSVLSQPNSHDCTNLALETINSLCQPSTLQRTGEGHPRPTIDQVLKMNSEAMKNVSTILSCNCAKDSSFPMLLSTILCKALAWYRAAVESHDTAFDDNTINSVKEEIVHRPISVGGYELDDESSDLMKIQLVLSRLRMMAKPVKQYMETYSASAYGHQPISPSSTGSPATKPSNAALAVSMAQMYSTMGMFIQGNLQSTVDELQSKLVMMGGHLQ